MPTCSQCRHENHADQRFCGNCGVELHSELSDTIASRPPSTPERSQHGRFEPGAKLGERYRIVGLLGRGGMGEVYRADDLELGQSVALKFLPERMAEDPVALMRFRGEVSVARQIAHPNVCRIYDIAEADGHKFISMEYVDGEDLASVLRRMGRPTKDKALEIARQLCLGLAAAHECKIIHRDLKPANVMIDGRGRVRIMDFGLAGMIEDLESDGDIAGTPAYMSPEQLRGDSISQRSDVYSLGLLLYELFTGRQAFHAEGIAELRKLQTSGSFTSPSSIVADIEPAVERAISRCLDADPEHRPASAYALLAALPGGDPLAAAAAAGELPSPELVANVATTDSLSMRVIAGLLVAAIAGLLASGLMIRPYYESLQTPAEELRLLAEAHVTEALGVELPRYSASSFSMARRDSSSGVEPIFWMRWSTSPIRNLAFHAPAPTLFFPKPGRADETLVVLDAAGDLISLRDWSEGKKVGLDFDSFTAINPLASVNENSFTALLVANILPIVIGTMLALRNLRLGIGDRRGAAVIFTSMLLLNLGQSAASIRLREDGLLYLLDELFAGRALGHAILHGVSASALYLSLEPFIRRHWPRLLVSWARLSTGRWRDPLVGRDVLIGASAGSALAFLHHLSINLAERLSAGSLDSSVALQWNAVRSLTSVPTTISLLFAVGTVCFLLATIALFLLFFLRLLTRSSRVAPYLTFIILGLIIFTSMPPIMPLLGRLAICVVLGGCIAFVVVRVGLVAALAMNFVMLSSLFLPMALDPSAWYFDRVAVRYLAVFALLVFGTWVSLSGRSFLAEILDDGGERAS